MLASELIDESFPIIHPEESIRRAIELFAERCVCHIPVLHDDKLVGILPADVTIHCFEKDVPISTLKDDFIHLAVGDQLHGLDVFEMLSKHELTAIPVLDDTLTYKGVIALDDFLFRISKFYSFSSQGGIIKLSIGKNDYSLTEISRLVESENNKIIALFMDFDELSGMIKLTIKTINTDIERIIASLERFGYTIDYFYPNQHRIDELEDRYKLLMKLLNI